MPKFLVEASYSPEGLRGLQKDTASGRQEAITSTVESAGGKVEAFYYALGDRDVLLIVDLPNTVTAASLALATSASGLVRTKTTALLTVKETDEALAMKPDYRAPGQ